jgi:hypothetical protein
VHRCVTEYLRHNPVPDSDARLLDTVLPGVTTLGTGMLNYDWAEGWIREMKRTQNLAPSTIRHRHGALARCHPEHGLYAILEGLRPHLPEGSKIHAFGVKGQAMSELVGMDFVISSDSMSYDLASRIKAHKAGQESAQLAHAALVACNDLTAQHGRWNRIRVCSLLALPQILSNGSNYA